MNALARLGEGKRWRRIGALQRGGIWRYSLSALVNARRAIFSGSTIVKIMGDVAWVFRDIRTRRDRRTYRCSW